MIGNEFIWGEGEEKSISKQEFPIAEKEHEVRRSNGHTKTKNQ
jgi:hypothetical protein